MDWIRECQHVLKDAMKASKDGDTDIVVDFIKNMVKMEIEARDTIHDYDTHHNKEYLDHLIREHLCLTRQSLGSF